MASNKKIEYTNIAYIIYREISNIESSISHTEDNIVSNYLVLPAVDNNRSRFIIMTQKQYELYKYIIDTLMDIGSYEYNALIHDTLYNMYPKHKYYMKQYELFKTKEVKLNDSEVMASVIDYRAEGYKFPEMYYLNDIRIINNEDFAIRNKLRISFNYIVKNKESNIRFIPKVINGYSEHNIIKDKEVSNFVKDDINPIIANLKDVEDIVMIELRDHPDYTLLNDILNYILIHGETISKEDINLKESNINNIIESLLFGMNTLLSIGEEDSKTYNILSKYVVMALLYATNSYISNHIKNILSDSMYYDYISSLSELINEDKQNDSVLSVEHVALLYLATYAFMPSFSIKQYTHNPKSCHKDSYGRITIRVNDKYENRLISDLIDNKYLVIYPIIDFAEISKIFGYMMMSGIYNEEIRLFDVENIVNFTENILYFIHNFMRPKYNAMENEPIFSNLLELISYYLVENKNYLYELLYSDLSNSGCKIIISSERAFVSVNFINNLLYKVRINNVSSNELPLIQDLAFESVQEAKLKCKANYNSIPY